MTIFSKIDQSADLMFGLSARMDVDLGTPVLADPQAAGKAYRAMVLRCTGCTNQAGCAALQRRETRIESAPDYCRNGDTLNAMRIR